LVSLREANVSPASKKLNSSWIAGWGIGAIGKRQPDQRSGEAHQENGQRRLSRQASRPPFDWYEKLPAESG
jgi:hypothetical protein